MKALLVISALGLVAMLAEILKFKRVLLPLSVIGILAALGLNIMEWNAPMDMPLFSNMVFFDRPALAFSGVILVTACLWFILANDYFHEDSSAADHYALVLFTLAGAMLLTAFRNMNTLFLGIEIMSIPLYVLAASHKKDLRSNEAGFKYLIMGSFASAFLLFGIALVYGASGSFDTAVIREYIAQSRELPLFFYTGVLMILVALCFKVSAAPFHFWAPDVYEGSPTLVTAFMSTIVKTAAFAAILRLFMVTLDSVSGIWSGTLAAVIALSLVIANFSAAVQNSVKRMLAFSSISHAGFMLMVVLANVRSNASLDALVYYALAYSVASVAAFGVLYNVTRHRDDRIDAFNGLAKRNPALAAYMTLAMLSLAGIPLTAGFFGKYFVFTNLMGSGHNWLLVLAIITSAVSVYYYLRVVVAMYFKDDESAAPVQITGSNHFVIALSCVITLLIGIVPGPLAQMFRF